MFARFDKNEEEEGRLHLNEDNERRRRREIPAPDCMSPLKAIRTLVAIHSGIISPDDSQAGELWAYLGIMIIINSEKRRW